MTRFMEVLLLYESNFQNISLLIWGLEPEPRVPESDLLNKIEMFSFLLDSSTWVPEQWVAFNFFFFFTE